MSQRLAIPGCRPSAAPQQRKLHQAAAVAGLSALELGAMHLAAMQSVRLGWAGCQSSLLKAEAQWFWVMSAVSVIPVRSAKFIMHARTDVYA